MRVIQSKCSNLQNSKDKYLLSMWCEQKQRSCCMKIQLEIYIFDLYTLTAWQEMLVCSKEFIHCVTTYDFPNIFLFGVKARSCWHDVNRHRSDQNKDGAVVLHLLRRNSRSLQSSNITLQMPALEKEHVLSAQIWFCAYPDGIWFE